MKTKEIPKENIERCMVNGASRVITLETVECCGLSLVQRNSGKVIAEAKPDCPYICGESTMLQSGNIYRYLCHFWKER